MSLLAFTVFLLLQAANGQQLSGNSINDFVGQLTNLFNQNGGLGGLGSALQQGPDGGFGLYNRPGKPPPYPLGPAYPPPRPPPPPGAGYPPVQQPYPVAPPYAPPYYPRPGGPSQGFFSALASIARYDDLRCVPRLLCEVTSGGKPGYAGSQQSIVPLTNKDSLIALLTVLNFIDDSPLLVFGRAALLGYTSRGNSRACLNAYPTCPRDPDTLVDYLNNHNGGFFRYFSGQPQPGAYPPGDQEPQYPYPEYPQDPQGQYPQRPYPPYSDNRYTNLYPNYQNVPYPQRPLLPQYYPKRPPYSQDPNQPIRYAGKYTAAKDYYQERIQVRPHTIYSYQPEYYREQEPEQSKLVFPTRTQKQLNFHQTPQPYSPSGTAATPVPFFPDRTGTGKLLLDSEGVHYAPPQNLINFRDQRSVTFPVNMNFPKS